MLTIPHVSLQNPTQTKPLSFLSNHAFSTTTMTTLSTFCHLPFPPPSNHLTRRSLLYLTPTLLSTPTPISLSTPLPTPDKTITDRIFLDLSFCPSYFTTRTVGESDPSLCSDPEPLGRITIGLYGNLVPITVSNFKSMITGSSGSTYKGTLIQKIFPGEFFIAGRQGRRDKGEVRRPDGKSLVRNTETVDAKAFVLGHDRAGVVSLCLSENDDDDEVKLDPEYHNVEFLVTTGPGPAPELDGRNIVFGTVIEGLDVVTAIASIPTYKPGERIKQYNDFAEFIGDGRAKTARAIWDRPVKTLYISDCGVLKVAKPTLSPSLP